MNTIREKNKPAVFVTKTHAQFFLYLWFILLSVSITTSAYALQQHTRLWLGSDLSGDLFNLSNWEYDVNSQARYNFTGSQYSLTQSEAGLGYKIKPNLSLWLGYTWIIENANVTQQHRIWNQVLWNILNNDQIHLTSRTRLEERKDIYEPQWSVRFRQRLQLTWPKKIFNTYTPIIYDELFLNFNNPSWVNNQLVNQNRIFIGISIPLWKKIDMQVGYLNQFQFLNPENRMSHIIYGNLNIRT